MNDPKVTRMADLSLTPDPEKNFAVYVRKIQQYTMAYEEGFEVEESDETLQPEHFDGFKNGVVKRLRIGEGEFLTIYGSDDTRRFLETLDEGAYRTYLWDTHRISDPMRFLFFVYWNHFRELLRQIEDSLLDYLVAKRKDAESRHHRDGCRALMELRTKSLEPLINDK